MAKELFYIGQEVTLKKKNNPWTVVEVTDQNKVGFPEFGKIYTVYRNNHLNDVVYIELEELRGNEFQQEAFVPVLPNDAIEELIEQSLQVESPV